MQSNSSAATKVATYEKKEKQISYGLDKPLSVKWKQDSIVGDYITMSLSLSKGALPTEFVISRLIGKSRVLPSETWVINRRHNIPELIKNAPDPMKKRHQEIADLMRREELVSHGLIEDVGAKFAITTTLSIELAGQDWTTFLDRTKSDLNKARERAREEHDKEQEGKPFRLKKKFVFTQTIQDFMSKPEKEALARINAVLQHPQFVEKVAKATASNHETLVADEQQQKPLVLPTKDWKEMSIEGILVEVGKHVFNVLQGTKPDPGSELSNLKIEVDKLRLDLMEARIREKRVHDYYKSSSTALAEAEAKISHLTKTVEDLREEIKASSGEEE